MTRADRRARPAFKWAYGTLLVALVLYAVNGRRLGLVRTLGGLRCGDFRVAGAVPPHLYLRGGLLVDGR